MKAPQAHAPGTLGGVLVPCWERRHLAGFEAQIIADVDPIEALRKE